NLGATSVSRRDAHFASLVGRLKSGVTPRQAEAEINSVAAQLEQQYPDTNSGQTEQVVPLHRDVVGDVRPALLILVGAVALVLLIACANVANLLLARSAPGPREIAISAVLGPMRPPPHSPTAWRKSDFVGSRWRRRPDFRLVGNRGTRDSATAQSA